MKNLKHIGRIAVVTMSIPMMSMAAESNRDKATRLNDEGVKMMQAQDYRGAIERFKEALDASPDCVSAARNVGKLLIMGLKYQEAADILEKTLKVVPNDSGCLVQMAQVCAILGATDKSIKCIEKVADAEDKSILRGLTALLLKQRSLKEAAVASEISIAKEPKCPEAWFNRGLVADAVKNVEIAGQSYERAVSLDPKYADAWVNLGNLHKREKNDSDALICYEKAYDAKKYPLSAYNLGKELVTSRKDVSRGLDLLNEAAQGDGVAAQQARTLINRMVDLLEDRKGGAK